MVERLDGCRDDPPWRHPRGPVARGDGDQGEPQDGDNDVRDRFQSAPEYDVRQGGDLVVPPAHGVRHDRDQGEQDAHHQNQQAADAGPVGMPAA